MPSLTCLLPRLFRREFGLDRDLDRDDMCPEDFRRGRGVDAIMSAMSGDPAPERNCGCERTEIAEAGVESEFEGEWYGEEVEARGAVLGKGGKSLFRTAVGGRGRVDGLGRR